MTWGRLNNYDPLEDILNLQRSLENRGLGVSDLEPEIKKSLQRLHELNDSYWKEKLSAAALSKQRKQNDVVRQFLSDRNLDPEYWNLWNDGGKINLELDGEYTLEELKAFVDAIELMQQAKESPNKSHD